MVAEMKERPRSSNLKSVPSRTELRPSKRVMPSSGMWISSRSRRSGAMERWWSSAMPWNGSPITATMRPRSISTSRSATTPGRPGRRCRNPARRSACGPPSRRLRLPSCSGRVQDHRRPRGLARWEHRQVRHGRVSLKQRAQKYLATAQNVGRVSEQAAAVEAQNKELQATVQAQADQLKELAEQVKALSKKKAA